MKRLIILFLNFTLFQAFGNNSATITGSVRSTEPFVIKFFEPIFGYYNNVNLDTHRINKILDGGAFYRKVNLDHPSFFSIVFFKENQFAGRANFLVFPKDSINIDFDLDSNNESRISYSGSNSAGNNHFEKINHVPYSKFIPVIQLIENLPADQEKLISNIEKEIIKITEPFKELRDKKMISSNFYNVITTNFRMLFYKEVIKKIFIPIQAKRKG